MNFKTTIEKFDSPLWGHHFKVAKEWVKDIDLQNNRRVICDINKDIKFSCALMPDGLGDFFININADIRKKLNLEIGSIVEITLEKDSSEYGLPMPEELQELLYQDEEGNQLFHALTKGKQRNLIYIVGQYKNLETRLNKAIIIINYLKSTGGKLNFKELNQAFKDPLF